MKGFRKRIRAAPMVATLVVVSVYVGVTVALAAPGDPRRSFKPADQAYATSFLLRKADLPGSGWLRETVDFSQPNPQCIVKRYSWSALTVTGEAGLTYIRRGRPYVIESYANVFVTSAQAGRAFAIDSTLGSARCDGSAVAAEIGAGVQGGSTKILSVKPVALEPLSAAAHAFRIALLARSTQGVMQVDVVFVEVRRGRALGSLALIRAAKTWPDSLVRSLTRKVASRMTKR